MQSVPELSEMRSKPQVFSASMRRAAPPAESADRRTTVSAHKKEIPDNLELGS